MTAVRRLVGYSMRAGRRLVKNLRDWRRLEHLPPHVLKVELTNICNADCIFCGYQYEERAKGYMDDSLYERVVTEYHRMGGATLSYIPIVGEPLLDKNLIEHIRFAKQRAGMRKVYIYTNGILLYKFDIKGLLTCGLDQLFISTSPFDAESFERLYRSNRYKVLIEGIEKTLILNRDLGKPVDIHFLIRSHIPPEQVLSRPDYLTHIRPYIDESKDIGVLLNGYDNWGGLIRQEDLIGDMKLAVSPRKTRPCSQTFSLTVLWDKRVRACGCRFNNAGEDPLIVGDLEQESLADIWNGDRLRGLRRTFVSGNLPAVCRDCTMYTPV